MIEKYCNICGDLFKTGYSNKKYCSARCAIQAEKMRAARAYRESRDHKETPYQRIKILEAQLEKCKAVMTDDQMVKAGL